MIRDPNEALRREPAPETGARATPTVAPSGSQSEASLAVDERLAENVRSSVPQPSASERRRAALNAALGDYLERRGNPLAIPMELWHQGERLQLSSSELRAAHLASSARIAVFVHGLGQTEACWSYRSDPSVTYGSLLREELGLVPLYVRYNTGRRISRNGKALSALLEELALALPGVSDISLIGHSLGGLVIRSACHYGSVLGHGWVTRTRRCVYLGSPHLGSPLEKAGALVSSVLGSIDNPVVRLIHEVTDLRGVGIKDLGQGCLLDEDWSSPAATPTQERRPTAIPLATGMAHYFIAGTLTRDANGVAAFLIGDSVVRVSSATGPARAAAVSKSQWAIAPGVAHMHLSRSPEVHALLRAWLAAELGPSDAAPYPSATSGPEPPRDARLEADAPQPEAYASLLGDAVERGATAIQRVQEELTALPYDLLERVPPLAMPVRVVRTLHLGGARTTYDIIRWTSRVGSAALGAALGWAARHPRGPKAPPEPSPEAPSEPGAEA